MVLEHQVQVGMRIIFSVVAVALNRILLGGAQRHPDAGYKLIVELNAGMKR